jgi:hypothetical protein
MPDLSDLIEACGDDLFSLIKTSDGWMAHAARLKGTAKKFVDHATGSTPEEAVGHLWLALFKHEAHEGQN